MFGRALESEGVRQAGVAGQKIANDPMAWIHDAIVVAWAWKILALPLDVLASSW